MKIVQSVINESDPKDIREVKDGDISLLGLSWWVCQVCVDCSSVSSDPTLHWHHLLPPTVSNFPVELVSVKTPLKHLDLLDTRLKSCPACSSLSGAGS